MRIDYTISVHLIWNRLILFGFPAILFFALMKDHKEPTSNYNMESNLHHVAEIATISDG